MSVFLDSISGILISEAKTSGFLRKERTMKGYYNNAGYMGYVEGRWMLFASESDYLDYMEA